MDDDLMDFFDFSKDIKRVVQRRPSDENKRKYEDESYSPVKSEPKQEIDDAFTKEIVEKEKLLLENIKNPRLSYLRERTMDEMECDVDDVPVIRSDADFYEKYNFDLNRNKTLPIYMQRETIVNAINEHPVVILSGETGCGKTTQVPQYILDEAFKRRQYCNIVVTQPRRIAAVSIATRVCEERNWTLGTVCSYQVGLHRSNTDSNDVRLLYCTTGVLLNQLVRDKTLTHYTHIVIDEVHERDQDMDFLLIVVRRLLGLNSRHVKVILMSATINAEEFRNYFATKTFTAPVVNASTSRKFSLAKFYRDQLPTLEPVNHDWKEPGIDDKTYNSAIKILLIIDNMERQRGKGVNKQNTYESGLQIGSVLMFLPGINEIETMAECIKNYMQMDSTFRITIICCHSLLVPESQVEVFNPPPPGFRKVILATNIAESSITVPDITYVIDFCLSKVLITDTATNFSKLKLVWASKVSCRQRAGRVGRLRPGRVYRMVSKSFYDLHMDEFGVPEMLRSPLQTSILKSKLLDMGKPLEILSLALSPPSQTDIKNTVLLLKEVGALYPTLEGTYDECDGDLTYWGVIMATLPLDVRLSRLIILGYLFNCVEEMQIIAAGLAMRSLYVVADRRRSYEQFWSHYIWADGSGCDLIGVWRLYNTYLNLCLHQSMDSSSSQWARRFGLNIRSLREMHLMVQDVRRRCEHLNLVPIPVRDAKPWTDLEKSIVFKVVIAGAFYPNYFTSNNKNVSDWERNLYLCVSGNDPLNTVYFTNFQSNDTGPLYIKNVKKLFEETNIPPERINVEFPPGSEKIFVSFKSSFLPMPADSSSKMLMPVPPGRITMDVYKAIRMRHERTHRPLNIIESGMALEYIKNKKIGKIIEGRWVPSTEPVYLEVRTFPSLFDKVIRGRITHVVHCGKFYFQPQSVESLVNSTTKVFNSQDLERFGNDGSDVSQGLIVLAWRINEYQRARVLNIETVGRGKPNFRVKLIDFGETSLLPLNRLRKMPPNLQREYGQEAPPRIFECRLALVAPSSISSCYRYWSEEANNMLRELIECHSVKMDVYSMIGNVASVQVHTPDGLINDMLVEKFLARRTDESFVSREDHDFRLRHNDKNQHWPSNKRNQMNMEYLRSLQKAKLIEPNPPPRSLCTRAVQLKGPYSPLEISLYAMTQAGTSKLVLIDSNSVNGVLLDIEPQDQHALLVVAASVSETTGHRNITLRNTTLMPNIHGFGALMTMLFCPTLQIKCNNSRTKYVSILAGLGYNPATKKPFYAEHDLVVNLDVTILKDDIRIINQMRYNMDAMFQTASPDETPHMPMQDRVLIFEDQRRLLERLLNKNRCFIEPNVSIKDNCWENLPDLEISPEPFGKRCLFPLHNAQNLECEKVETLVSLTQNCKKLYEWRHFESPGTLIHCALCNKTLESVTELRMHLLTQMHCDRERQIGFKKTEKE